MCIGREKGRRKTKEDTNYTLKSEQQIEWFWKCLFVCWDDKDRDDYNKQWRRRRRQRRQQKTHIALRWFDIMLMLILHTHSHAREKPIKSRHPLNSRIYCFLFALLCFTSHCDLCSGFWLCFPFPPNQPTIGINHHHRQPFNRQPRPIPFIIDWSIEMQQYRILECAISIRCHAAMRASKRERDGPK